ncbi:MAG TPA: formate dehydrogenase accessory sulfurtransferase FdhD [Ktedonobacterales bacterium]|nr:formate dehydrogenase accessory sulfurtransferase FdhD [Ktedonobacterales bacterium]
MGIPSRSQFDPLRQVTTPIVRWQGVTREHIADELVAEEPLEIRVKCHAPDGTISHESLAVIMRTPGQDDELAAGFLFSEGLLVGRGELRGIEPGFDTDGLPSDNVVDVVTIPGVDLTQRARDEGYSRKFAVNASCGICGKNTVSAACAVLPPVPRDDFVISPELIYTLPDRLRTVQRVFDQTGGLHGAGIFDRGANLIGVREDIGRHNAVDKLIGRALLDGVLPLRRRILMVSGRLSFEIVLKALAAGIPLIAAVSAPSSLAIDLANIGGITITAFVRGTSMNVYTHPERVRAG